MGRYYTYAGGDAPKSKCECGDCSDGVIEFNENCGARATCQEHLGHKFATFTASLDCKYCMSSDGLVCTPDKEAAEACAKSFVSTGVFSNVASYSIAIDPGESGKLSCSLHGEEEDTDSTPTPTPKPFDETTQTKVYEFDQKVTIAGATVEAFTDSVIEQLAKEVAATVGVEEEDIIITVTSGEEGVVVTTSVKLDNEDAAMAAHTKLTDTLGSVEEASDFLATSTDLDVTATAIDTSDVSTSIVDKEGEAVGGGGLGVIVGAAVGGVVGVALIVAVAVKLSSQGAGDGKGQFPKSLSKDQEKMLREISVGVTSI